MILRNRCSCLGLNENDQPCRFFHNNLEESFSGDAVATCEAFPSGIPKDIITGEFDHINPYPNDNSIRYEPLGTNKPIYKTEVSEQLNGN